MSDEALWPATAGRLIRPGSKGMRGENGSQNQREGSQQELWPWVYEWNPGQCGWQGAC